MILYTTHCPKCNILEKKLQAKNISYEVCEDKAIMLEKKLTYLPVLEIDGKFLDFSSAVSYINNFGE